MIKLPSLDLKISSAKKLYIPLSIIVTIVLLHKLCTTVKTIPIPVSNLHQIPDFFPITEGTYWAYEGTKREEQLSGEVVTSNISKKVTVTKIGIVNNKTVVSLEGGNSDTLIIKDNTIDFEPTSNSDMKFSLAFPLSVGQRWGDEEMLSQRDDGYYVWEVEEKLSMEILEKNYDDCFRIAYNTLPDTTYKVFCYGVGIVEEGYKHNGTVMEFNYNLVSTNVFN